jgi:hypothetical protein
MLAGDGRDLFSVPVSLVDVREPPDQLRRQLPASLCGFFQRLEPVCVVEKESVFSAWVNKRRGNKSRTKADWRGTRHVRAGDKRPLC